MREEYQKCADRIVDDLSNLLTKQHACNAPGECSVEHHPITVLLKTMSLVMTSFILIILDQAQKQLSESQARDEVSRFMNLLKDMVLMRFDHYIKATTE